MGMTYVVTWAGATAPELARVAAALDDPTAADREAVWMDSILRRYPTAMGESSARGTSACGTRTCSASGTASMMWRGA